MKAKPWWSDGIEFLCQPDCGKCCEEPNGMVFLAESDIIRLANHFDLTTSEYLRQHCKRSIDGRFILASNVETQFCQYYNENKQCDVYVSRPSQCQAFPFWQENLATKKHWKQVVNACPGLQSEDGILIDGNAIRLHMNADRIASVGIRHWSSE